MEDELTLPHLYLRLYQVAWIAESPKHNYSPSPPLINRLVRIESRNLVRTAHVEAIPLVHQLTSIVYRFPGPNIVYDSIQTEHVYQIREF